MTNSFFFIVPALSFILRFVCYALYKHALSEAFAHMQLPYSFDEGNAIVDYRRGYSVYQAGGNDEKLIQEM